MDNTFIKERLDRAMANVNQTKIYNFVQVENLVPHCFDHRPLLVYCLTQAHGRNGKEKKLDFEVYWNIEE